MATEQNTTEVGTALSPDEEADFAELRALFSPSQSLRLLDNFAKWLFASAGIVGVLGSGFGLSKANNLHGSGRRLFAWAVVCLGLSLALAALARLPILQRVNRYSPEDMRSALHTLYFVRCGLLAGSALLFAAALALAGFAPLESD